MSEGAAIEREASGLQALANLLAQGKDVPGARVREVADIAAKLAATAERVRRLEEGQPADEKLRAERAALGEELIRFLDRWTRSVPPALATALTDRAGRERVSAAIKQSEAARGGQFATAWEHTTRGCSTRPRRFRQALC